MVGPYNENEINSRRNHMMVPAHAHRERVRWLATVDARDQRIAALDGEVADLRRYRESWDKELADARRAAADALAEVKATEGEAWSAESWFLRQMKRSTDPETRKCAENYPDDGPAPWVAEVERLLDLGADREAENESLRGLLERAGVFVKACQHYEVDPEVSDLDAEIDAALRGGKEEHGQQG